MKRNLLAGTSLALAFVGAALAAEYGSAAEAKAMLDKAVVAVKADKTKALAAFTGGQGGFKDRDLYPFCANAADGNFSAHPALMGKSLKELKDKTGKAMGEEMLKVAAEGKVSEVAYMWPRPGSTDAVQKVSYVTKIGDQVCAVGYYK
jgi:signal transduction histidine kinase